MKMQLLDKEKVRTYINNMRYSIDCEQGDADEKAIRYAQFVLECITNGIEMMDGWEIRK